VHENAPRRFFKAKGNCPNGNQNSIFLYGWKEGQVYYNNQQILSNNYLVNVTKNGRKVGTRGCSDIEKKKSPTLKVFSGFVTQRKRL
jgi:hypothetical protein